MNYKLLANVNYSVISKNEETGILTVHASMENKKAWNEELIVQEFEENEGQALYDIPMVEMEKEVEIVTAVVKKDDQDISVEDDIEIAVQKLDKLFGPLWHKMGIKVVEEVEFKTESYMINPPPHEIRKEILMQMGIIGNEVNRDFREEEETPYDGYVPDGCASDGTPLF